MANSWNAYTFSSGKSLNRGFSDSWRKRLEDELEKQAEQKLVDQQKQAADEKKKQDEKPWYQKAAEWTGDAAATVGAGIQQGVGTVADVATQGGALLDEAANQLKGGTEEEKNKRREKNLKGTEAVRDWIHNQTDIKGNKIGGTQDVDEAASRIASGKGDAKDYLAVGGKGLETGLDATMFTNPTRLLVGGARKEAGKEAVETGLSLAKNTAKQQAEKLTTKEAAKFAARDAAFFGSGDAVATGAQTYGETGDAAKALEEGAKAGLLSAATQGTLDIGGHVAGKAIGRVKNGKEVKPAEEVNPIDQAAAQAADDLDNPFRDMSTDELRAQVDEFSNGGGRTGDVQADYQKMQAVKDELSAREKDDYFKNGGMTPQEAQKALDDFDAGNMPESVYTEAAPVRGTEDVVNREDLPVEIKNAAEEVEADREMIRNQMDGLMSPETKADEIANLDERYDLAVSDLQKKYSSLEQPTRAKDSTVDQTVSGQRLSGDYKSDVRFQMAKDRLDEQYRNDMAELDMLEAQDLEEVAKYQGMMDTLDTREQNIMMDTNTLMRSAPDQFRDVNPDEAAAQRALLEDNLNQAKRFGDAKEIVTEAATSPNPAKSLDTPDGKTAVRTDMAESTAHLEGFKNSSRVRQSVMGLMSPSKNLDAMGLRPLADKVMTADAAQQLANKADIEVISKIAQKLDGNQKLGDEIIDYLEGNRQTLSGTDKETADMIKAFLDEKKAWLKDNGFATIEDYFPHMFDKSGEQARRLFKGKTTGDINFNNLKQRKSDSADYSRDIVDVLAQYSQSFNKKRYLEPALKPLEDLRNYEKVTNLEAKWVDDYIAQLKNTKVGKTEEGFNNLVDAFLQKTGKTGNLGGNHYRSVLGGQRMISAVATMGMNPGTAIRNMTQTVNTIAGIGPKWSTVGLVRGTRALRAGKNSPEFKEMAEAGVFSGGVSKNYNADLDEFSGKIIGLKGRANGVANKMMIMVSSTDAFMRSQAYWGAKSRALAKGASEADARAYARGKVQDTQFVTSKVDMPTNLNGPGMRSLTQLATFSAKQAEFLGELGVKLVKGDNGKYGFSRPEQVLNLLAAAGAAGVATEALEPLIGFNAEEFVPFYPQLAPFIPGADADVSDALYRSPLVTLLAGDGKSKMGLVEAVQSGNPGEWLKDQWSQIVPGGTQIKKSTEGFGTTTSGESRNAKGNIRYLQDMSIEDQLKASLFGQYSTEAGRGWIDEGFPTLSENQTEKVDEQTSREAKQMYVDFYQARKKASGRQDAFAAVKEAALAGDNNRAARLADEYNQKVTDSMAEYWEQHDDMPQELQDEMLSKLYINVNNVIKNANK